MYALLAQVQPQPIDPGWSTNDIIAGLGLAFTVIASLCTIWYIMNNRMNTLDKELEGVKSGKDNNAKSIATLETKISTGLDKVEAAMEEVNNNIQDLRLNLAQANFTAMSNRIERLEALLEQRINEIRRDYVSHTECQLFRKRKEDE